jgi:tRNA (guanine-N7-)-methyltransferase
MEEDKIVEDSTLEALFTQIPELKTVEHRDENAWRTIKSYVLRGQRLKSYQIEALKNHFYDYAVVHSFEKLDFATLFGNNNPVVIEIGFGMGDSTARIARENPNINYLGIEVFLYGFSKLLSTIANEGLTNLRIMRYDAVQVLEDMIEDGSVSGFHIFFPDPWPKKRHHKKRLVQLPFTTLLAQKLKKGGYIYCVTDWEDYAKQMLSVLEATPSMVNPYADGSLSGFAPARPWRPETSFERKGLDKSYTINEVWVEKV